MALFWMLHFFADLFGRFAFARRGPRFIHGDLDGRNRGAVHSGETNDVTMRIGNRNRAVFFICKAFFTMRSMIRLASE